MTVSTNPIAASLEGEGPVVIRIFSGRGRRQSIAARYRRVAQTKLQASQAPYSSTSLRDISGSPALSPAPRDPLRTAPQRHGHRTVAGSGAPRTADPNPSGGVRCWRELQPMADLTRGDELLTSAITGSPAAFSAPRRRSDERADGLATKRQAAKNREADPRSFKLPAPPFGPARTGARARIRFTEARWCERRWADCKQCPNCRRLKKLLIYRESMRHLGRENSPPSLPRATKINHY